MHKKISKLFINYKIHKADHATGLRFELLSLFSMSFTMFGFKGKRYMDKRGLFNIDISFQITPNIWRNRLLSIAGMNDQHKISMCRKCGPLVKHFAEHWVKGKSGPYMIEFIEYDDSAKPVIVDSVDIFDKPKGKSIKYLKCINCDSMIESMPMKQVERIINRKSMEKR